MSLSQFAQNYDLLSALDQATFAEAIQRLMDEGFIWQEEEADRRAYNFIARRQELVADYLRVGGWELRHHEQLHAFQLVHGKGARRRRLDPNTTFWLLFLRLMYAEKSEKKEGLLTRYPVVTIDDIVARWAKLFPDRGETESASLYDALPTLHSLKLIRPAGGEVLRTGNSEQQIELLPTLEIVVPAEEIAALAQQLGERQT
ncbi:MAG: DUF4194 domain-containing protein [Chloroflexi bacterium]|nr:DUF4194 domain-containing protein [Chloroflexota bacterium]